MPYAGFVLRTRILVWSMWSAGDVRNRNAAGVLFTATRARKDASALTTRYEMLQCFVGDNHAGLSLFRSVEYGG